MRTHSKGSHLLSTFGVGVPACRLSFHKSAAASCLQRVANLVLSGGQASSASAGDLEYWNYLWNRLFKKIGAASFVTNPDGSGNLQYTGKCTGSALDYARFGQLYLQV